MYIKTCLGLLYEHCRGLVYCIYLILIVFLLNLNINRLSPKFLSYVSRGRLFKAEVRNIYAQMYCLCAVTHDSSTKPSALLYHTGRFLKFVNSDERIFRHCRFCYRDHHCIGVDSLIDSQIFMISFVQHAIQTEDNQ